MTTELTKELRCIAMRNGVQIWIEKDRIEKLLVSLTTKEKGFYSIDEELINIADVVGIFSPKMMESMIRRKNGQWECKYGNWHERREPCECSLSEKDGSVFVSGAGWIRPT